jgi:hypothetical protein
VGNVLRRYGIAPAPKTTPLPVFDVFATPAGALFDMVKDKVTMNPDITLQPALHGTRTWTLGDRTGGGEWTLRIRAAGFATVGTLLDNLLVLFEFTV